MAEASQEFFSLKNNHLIVIGAIERISSIFKQDEFETQRNRHIINILSSISSHPQDWDESCSINIQWIGSNFISNLVNLSSKDTKDEFDLIYAFCFRFLLELHLSKKNELSIELEHARSFAIQMLSSFSQHAQGHIEFAWRDMPISILKSLMSSDQIQTLRDFSKTVDFAQRQKETWETELQERETRVRRLKDNLDQYESGFNFVGLHQGFEEMAIAKNKEKDSIKFWLTIFGILIILPFIIEASVIWTNLQEIEKLRTALIISIVPTVSLAGILIFYFRVLLHNYNATKSQILQIELRKTLCRFIQSYVVYAEKMNEKNQTSLSRFEGIIFSGLVSSDDKLPSTFDGLEQIGNILKSMKK